MSVLTTGNVYDNTYFENFGPTYHDFFWYTVVDDVPTITKHLNGTQGPNFFHVNVPSTNPSTGYVFKMSETEYRFMGYSNTATTGFCYVDTLFKNWMMSHGKRYHVFEQSIETGNGTYTHNLVTFDNAADPNNHTVIQLWSSVPKYWESPMVSNTSEEDYISSLNNGTDVRFLLENPNLYPPTDPCEYPPIDPYNATTQDVPLDNANILNAKAVYENNCHTYDCVIARLNQELQEEHNVRDLLQGDQANVLPEVENFVNTKAVEINDKLNTVTQIRSELETLIPENLANLQSNTDLYNYIQSQPATDLSLKIFDLDHAIHDAVAFLQSHNRYGTSNDIIYLYGQPVLP